MERWVIDGFEESLVRVELHDGSIVDLPRSWLPDQAKEGDVLEVEFISSSNMKSIQITVDREETKARRARLAALRDSLPKAPEGDISL